MQDNRSPQDVKLKAQGFLASGQNSEAKTILVPFCAQRKTDPDAWLLLGRTHSNLQSWEEAIACFRTVLELRPKDPNAHFQMGNVFLALRRYPEAIASYERSLVIVPQWPEALNNVGRALHLSGEPEQAIPRFEQVLSLDPNLSTTAVNLALAYRDVGQYLKAIECLQRALRLKPNWPPVQVMLGQVYTDIGMHDFAVRCFQDAIAQEPGSEAAYLHLGNAYRFQGRLDLALDTFRQVARLNPSSAEAAVGEAIIHEYAGRQEQTVQAVRGLLDRGVQNADLLSLFADICKRMNACDEAVKRISEALYSKTLSATGRTMLWFSLGKLYDDRGNYERAFESFSEGNRLMKVGHDPAIHRSHVGRIMEAFSRAAVRDMPRASNGSDKPVFVIGMPRSGTTLLEQMLSGHPQIHGAGELSDVSTFVQSLPYRLGTQRLFPECLGDLTQRHVDDMAAEYLATIQAIAPAARFVVDKMPHNFLYLGLINLLFPKARVIHCTRDPLDTCLSVYFQYFGPRIPYAYRLDHIAAFYTEYRRLMQHWEETLDIEQTTVAYADLVGDAEATMRRTLSFLGLSWASECLTFHTRRQRALTASYQQVRRPLYKTSLERWRNYEPYLDPLRTALAPWLT